MEVYHAPTIHKDTVNILLDGNAMAAGLLKNGHSRMVTPKKMNLDGGFLGAEESDYVPYIETCDKIMPKQMLLMNVSKPYNAN